MLEHELEIIEELHFPGYFLVVWEIARFCRDNGILCQGRGQRGQLRGLLRAADHRGRRRLVRPDVRALPRARAWRAAGHRHRHRVRPPRGGHPARLRDARPRARRPGRERHHLPAEVGGARHRQGARLLPRPAGRVEQGDRAGLLLVIAGASLRQLPLATARGRAAAGGLFARALIAFVATQDDLPASPTEFSSSHELQNAPRHLGIHSGGMVMCDRPVIEVCPVEWGRMPGRTVLQWDKDDCAEIGLVKFDLLGLGMLSAIQYCFELITKHHGGHLRAGDDPGRGAVRLRHALRAPTRSACSRSSPARRWRPCPGSSHATSTTSHARWR